MGYRWIGAILIIGSCSCCGFSISAGQRREEQLLCQLLRSLQLMESELKYRLTPLPELCYIAAHNTRGILRTVFLNLHSELTSRKLPDAGSCMSAAISRSGEIPPRTRRILGHLGYTLGRFDLEGQLQGIQSARNRCESSLLKIQENKKERLRSYQTLGICAGMALAIVLI